MGDQTAISWTDHTFNIFWGCDKVSPGCNSCYAETFDHRLGGEHWGPTAPRRFFGDAYWRKPLAWNAAAERAGVRASVFCSSMADWAEIHQVREIRERQDEARDRLWRLINETPWLDWLMLTKRPENFARLLPWSYLGGTPYPNVTLMVTGENTEQLLQRTAILRRTPAARRGISAEPLLEHIPAEAWDDALGMGCCKDCGRPIRQWATGGFGGLEGRIACGCNDESGRGPDLSVAPMDGVHWLIVGDESGPNRRPAQLDWVRTAREAALRHGVAFHLKQLHVNGKVVHLPMIDGRRHDLR